MKRRETGRSLKAISSTRRQSSLRDRTFKFVKGASLLALAFGVLSLLHKDVAAEVQRWLDQLRVDPDNRFISQTAIGVYQELKEISSLGAGHAALFLTEGTGLLFRKRWAEWLQPLSLGIIHE